MITESSGSVRANMAATSRVRALNTWIAGTGLRTAFRHGATCGWWPDPEALERDPAAGGPAGDGNRQVVWAGGLRDQAEAGGASGSRPRDGR